jgi:hypothetical protein
MSKLDPNGEKAKMLMERLLGSSAGSACPQAIRACCGEPWACAVSGGECGDPGRMDCAMRPGLVVDITRG